MNDEHPHTSPVEGEHTHAHIHSHIHEHTHDGAPHKHEHTHEHTHSHTHPHDHTQLHDVGTGHEHTHMPLEHLTALMKYMVNHNTAHMKELTGLSDQLERTGQRNVVEKVKAAVAAFEQGNGLLSDALAELETT